MRIDELKPAPGSRKRRKRVVDQVAAVFFLQGYLDFRARRGA